MVSTHRSGSEPMPPWPYRRKIDPSVADYPDFRIV